MKSVVLLSSGLDSTINLYQAHRLTDIQLVLTFNYEQKAAAKEIYYSRLLCEKLGLRHQVIDLHFFKEFTKTALIHSESSIPKGEEVNIDSLEVSQETAQTVWVPNRNGIFVNVAGGFAEGLGADSVIVGFNKEEAQTFPDNSEDFITRLNESLGYSTANKTKVLSYTIHLNKPEIVALGCKLGVDFKLIWTCYEGESKPCGKCESCSRFAAALKMNKMELSELWPTN